MKEEMVIFTRVYDFIIWLIPRTMNFPRSQRFIVTKRLQDAILDFYELIIEANTFRASIRIKLLYQALKVLVTCIKEAPEFAGRKIFGKKQYK